MNDRLDELVQTWLDGELTAAELSELRTAISAPSVLARAAAHLREHQLLRVACRSEAGAGARRVGAVIDQRQRGRVGTLRLDQIRARIRPRSGWRWWAAVAAVLVMGIAVSRFAFHSPIKTIATLELATSGVQVIRAGQAIHVASGMKLFAQDRIQVAATPADAQATVIYPDHTRMQVRPATAVRIWDEDGAKRVGLESGEVRCDVTHQPSGRRLKMLTAQADAEVLGTRFTLQADRHRTRLAVEVGQVWMRRADGANLVVPAGSMAVAGTDIPFALTPIPSPSTRSDPPSAVGSTAARLSGDTSQPSHSCFVVGQAVRLTFAATGLAPLGSDQLILRIVDEHESAVQDLTVPVRADAAGEWSQVVDAPHSRLGFYRVHARLASGATLPGLPARPAGYLTYAVLPDPALRPAVRLESAFFGIVDLPARMPALRGLLGSRWVTVGRWDQECPDEPLSAIPALPQLAHGGAWTAYPVFVGVTRAVLAPWVDRVFVPGSCRLVPGSGEEILRQRCIAVAQARMREAPGLAKRIYTIWEPEGGAEPWTTTAQDLTRLYQIAHTAIHAIDPDAVVVGIGIGNYTGSDLNPTYDQLYDAGLFTYLDAVSVHLYLHPDRLTGIDQGPETVSPSLGSSIRDLKAWMRRRLGRELPVYGTEQGFSAGSDPDPAQELRQAQYHIRSNLILLGEGLAFNLGFHGMGFSEDTGLGFTYNLDLDAGAESEKVGPKPSAAAYAAMTFRLEGRTHATPVTGLGATGMGYAYANERDVVMALWDYGRVGNAVEVPVDVPLVMVYDWMGNGRQVTTDRGVLRLELGNDPLYVVKPLR